MQKMSSLLNMIEEREKEVVRALSLKYKFNESEAREYIKMLETNVSSSSSSCVLVGRPSQQRVENSRETEDEAFCALVEQSEKKGKVEYKKLEKKSKEPASESGKPKPSLTTEESLHVPLEKAKEQESAKPAKKTVKKVAVPAEVAQAVVQPVVQPVVVQAAPEKVVKKAKVKVVVDKEAKDREVFEIIAKAKAAKEAKEAKDREAAEILAKAKEAKEAAEMQAKTKVTKPKKSKKEEVAAPVVAAVVVAPVVEAPVVEVKVAAPVPKEVKVVKEVKVAAVVAAPVVAAPVVVQDVLKGLDEESEDEELEDEELEEEVVEDETTCVNGIIYHKSDETIRHNGTMYLKSKDGVVYEVFNREKVGKLDASGKVVLDAQEVEEELCTESESDGDETELMTDSDEDE